VRSAPPRERRHLIATHVRSHPRRVLLIAAISALPAVAVALLLLWRGDFSSRAQWTGTLFAMGGLGIGLLVLQERIVRPLQTL
jgi:two-component system nitrogen regulation sensor histidine kinase NtrY